MANRRMFSLDVVDTDKFLDMPTTSQNLYFHLGMRADDDGFVSSPKKIAAMVGANQDDLKLLIAKGFIIAFDEGGIVVLRHWRQNNLIRSDRYKSTIYQQQMAALSVNNGVYSLVAQRYANGVPEVAKMETQYREDKIKESISISKYSMHFEKFWSVYPRKKEKSKAYKAYCTRLKDGFSEDELLQAAQGYAAECKNEKREEKYIKLCATFLSASTPFTDYLDNGKGVGAIESENKGRGQASDYFRRFIRDCDCDQG